MLANTAAKGSIITSY